MLFLCSSPMPWWRGIGGGACWVYWYHTSNARNRGNTLIAMSVWLPQGPWCDSDTWADLCDPDCSRGIWSMLAHSERVLAISYGRHERDSEDLLTKHPSSKNKMVFDRGTSQNPTQAFPLFSCMLLPELILNLLLDQFVSPEWVFVLVFPVYEFAAA